MSCHEPGRYDQMPLKFNRHDKFPATSQKRAVDEYIDLYHELLNQPGKIVLDKLEAAHRYIDSSLHRSSGSDGINLSAFAYSAERLPACLPDVKQIIMAPTEEVFVDCGYGQILNWKRNEAPRRRRRAHYDGGDILAMFVTSISDFDEIIPSLCAYQIEWNAMHSRLHDSAPGQALLNGRVRASDVAEEIRRLLNVNKKDWDLFLHLWPNEWDRHLQSIADAPKKLIIERLPLQHGDFERSVANWFDAVMDHFSDINFETQPVYFVSSNTHSIANLISGYARKHRDEIISDTLGEMMENDDYLLSHWERLKYENESLRIDFLYYALRAFLEKHPNRIPEKIALEESVGIRRFTPDHFLHLEAQIIDLSKIDSGRIDPGPVAGRSYRTRGGKQNAIGGTWKDDRSKQEQAVIFNIDYPFGYSAYYLMKLILARMKKVRGVFILGKSAAMIGRLGDIMIPREARDAHSGNLYRFHNYFSAGTIVPYVADAAVFDEQRTYTVRGTFLHSMHSVKDFRSDDFTGIEMETGPYLSAIDEHLSGTYARHDTAIDIPSAFPIGILHYTSDTPYNLRANLLSNRMGLKGLEATYACSRAILNAIRGSFG